MRQNSLLIFSVLLMLATPLQFFANERLVLSGIYQGSDIYVQNPFSGQGVSFCVFEVRINGEVSSDEVNSSAFVVDLAIMGLEIGDEVEIIISHKDGCEPRVLNPEVLKPRSTFEVTDIGVNEDYVLNWTTRGEAGQLPYIIEQFRWNKWVRTGEVPGEGTPGTHEYAFQLEPHSGLNRVRIRQTDYRDETRTSPIVEYEGPSETVSFSPEKPQDAINFTKTTRFEIFDQYGNLVKTGYDRSVDVAELEKGEYYLNYDRSFGETFKKR